MKSVQGTKDSITHYVSKTNDLKYSKPLERNQAITLFKLGVLKCQELPHPWLGCAIKDLWGLWANSQSIVQLQRCYQLFLMTKGITGSSAAIVQCSMNLPKGPKDPELHRLSLTARSGGFGLLLDHSISLKFCLRNVNMYPHSFESSNFSTYTKSLHKQQC